MTVSTNRSSLSLADALHAFAVAQALPDATLLDEFTRRYPEHASALTELAITLVVDALLDQADDETLDQESDSDGPDEVLSPAVSRAISHFQNALHATQSKKPVAPKTTTSSAAVPNPFSGLDRAGFRVVAEKLDVSSIFLLKIRDRQVVADTVPVGFRSDMARALGVEVGALDAHLRAPAAMDAAQSYKSDVKPAIQQQVTFEQAVRDSGLSDGQQKRLLRY